MGKLKNGRGEFKDEEEKEKHKVQLREGKTLARMRQNPHNTQQVPGGT